MQTASGLKDFAKNPEALHFIKKTAMAKPLRSFHQKRSP